jgi:hypothetical protein
VDTDVIKYHADLIRPRNRKHKFLKKFSIIHKTTGSIWNLSTWKSEILYMSQRCFKNITTLITNFPNRSVTLVVEQWEWRPKNRVSVSRNNNKRRFHSVEKGSRAHPTSYRNAIGDFFPGGKITREWSWPFTSIYCLVSQRWSYNSTPQHICRIWCWDKFIPLFYIQ